MTGQADDRDASSPAGQSEVAAEAMLLPAAKLVELQAKATRDIDSAALRCQATTSAVTRQRSQFESVEDVSRRLDARLHDARNAMSVLADTLERIKLVALNAGLEGARIGEAAGTALVSVAEEVREIAGQGIELVGHQKTSINQLDFERSRLGEIVDATRSQLDQVVEQLRETTSAQSEVQLTLATLGEVLQSVTGLDGETASNLTRAADHAQALVDALKDLQSSRNRQVIRSALSPIFESLLPWFGGTATDPNADERPT